MNSVRSALFVLLSLAVIHGVTGYIHNNPNGAAVDYPEDEVQPTFTKPVANITVPKGRDAKIECEIDNLGDFRPAWIKEEDKAILTMHQQIISRNYRVSLSTSDNRKFTLHIRNVQEQDRGGYMCQINTSPVRSSVGYLDVLDGKYFDVEVSPEQLKNKDASAALRCASLSLPLQIILTSFILIITSSILSPTRS